MQDVAIMYLKMEQPTVHVVLGATDRQIQQNLQRMFRFKNWTEFI